MIPKKVLISLSILISVFLLVGKTASAQGNLSIQGQYSDIIQEQVDITVIPTTPVAYDKVSISIADYSSDLDRSQISWSLNGKAQQSGTGLKSFNFTMGGKGESMTVGIKIQPSNGALISKSITLTPEDVDLLWQADSYTPPFYKGKALYPPEGDLQFVALPDFVTSKGAQINPGSLIYKWTQDGTVLGSQSGYGRNTLSFTGSILSKPTTMTVEVSTLKGDTRARKSITVTPETTKAILYENSPVYGILFNRSLPDTFTLTKKEGKFEVFPYFFSGQTRSNPDIQYSWKLNNEPLYVAKTQHAMVFRNENNEAGTALAGVEVTDLSKLIQVASSQVSITYASDSIKKFFNGQ